MDIAEIRKKAKVGKPVTKKTEKPAAVEADCTPAELSGELPSTDLVVTDSAPSPSAVEPAIDMSGLNRLFADAGMLELASEEAYHEMLSGQSEQQTQSIHQYLAFNLGKEEYALDIGQISEIIKLREFTDIPRAPDFILGIISLRGVIVPVFDLMKRLRLGESSITSASRIIVCQEDELRAGLLVDSINQVINLEEKNIEPPPAVLAGFDRDLVKGVGRSQGRMIILLHLASVLDVGLK